MPVHADLANPDYVAWRRFLADADGWSRDQIADYQLQELQRVLRHAATAPGYARAFADAGVAPDDLTTLDDLRRFPCIDKETLRDHLDAFSLPWPDREYVTTGGSTGVPFGMYRNRDAFAKELASKAHQYARIGWREGDRQLVFRGLPIATPDLVQYVPKFEELRCSSYHLTPEHLARFADRALAYQPDWIRCYPSSGVLVAAWLRDTGHPFPPVKGVLCASENLYDGQKRLLAEVFGGRVFSHYGHYELAALAGFCERADTYHVLPQYGYVELLDADGHPVRTPGQVGEIVATSFLMRATPMVRYRTRDFAVFGGDGCDACGRPYAWWSRIEGRLHEFIITGQGRLISMTAINFHDDIFDDVRQFQFHQRERGRVTLRYIPRPEAPPRDVLEATLRRRLHVKLGDDVDLRFEPVASIPLTARGKHRFLIQELPIAQHDIGAHPAWAMERR